MTICTLCEGRGSLDCKGRGSLDASHHERTKVVVHMRRARRAWLAGDVRRRRRHRALRPAQQRERHGVVRHPDADGVESACDELGERGRSTGKGEQNHLDMT